MKGSAPSEVRPLAANKPAARSSAQLAAEASRSIEKAQAEGATKRVKVVATKQGYDGRVLRQEGDRFFVHLKEGQKLPSWQMLEPEFEAEEARVAAAADAEEED